MKLAGGLIERMRSGEAPPTRHANPYLVEGRELLDVLYTPAEIKERTSTASLFPVARPLVIEIGCYMGKTLVELASANPELNVLGLDITYKRTVKAARKIKLESIANARVAICEGQEALSLFPDAGLEGVCVFFPDPWPKAKHEKHRLLKEGFFENLRMKLSPTGFFWLKTDHADYFAQSLAAGRAAGFVVEVTRDIPRQLKESAYLTVFEQIFMNQGLPTQAALMHLPG